MKKGEQTRQRIVVEAAALLNQHGFEGLSYSDLMASTGLRKGGIYRHFSGKEDLAATAFEYAWEGAVALRFKDLSLIDNSVERLKQFVDNFVQNRPSVPGGCPLMNAAIDSDDGNPRLRACASRALQSWLANLSREVKRGQRRGEIREGIAARSVATLLVSTLEGALMINRLEGNSKALMDARTHLWSYLESEVRTAPELSLTA